MSGGHWQYKDSRITELNIDLILQAMKDCLHEVDWVLSGDTSQAIAEKELFEIVKRLGDALWPI